MAAARDGVGVVGGRERGRDFGVVALGSINKFVAEIGGRAVGLDGENAVARGGEPVVAGDLEGAGVGRLNVFVPACVDDLGVLHTTSLRAGQKGQSILELDGSTHMTVYILVRYV